jgi:polyhydroxyalkanoate synthesis regulator phasin
MSKRVLTSFFAFAAFAFVLALGVAACSGDKKIDKEGTIDQLVDSGVMNREQAECAVDRLDAEFGDDSDVIEELTKATPDLSAEDQAKVTDIVSGCLTGGGTTDTTAGG